MPADIWKDRVDTALSRLQQDRWTAPAVRYLEIIDEVAEGKASAAEIARRAGSADLVTSALNRITVSTDLKDMGEFMFGAAMGSLEKPTEAYKIGLTSTRLLLAAGDVVIGWLLLRAAIVAQARLEAGDAGKDTDFYTGKVAAAQFFARNVLPKLSAERQMAEAVDLSLMDLPESAF